MSAGLDATEPAAGGLEFLVLGSLEVRRAGVRIELGPPKQRAVLALLLLNANHVVATERLIDELWGESPPETARAALQVYIAGLRKALGNGHGTLATRSPGYVFEVDPDAVDLHRFDRLRNQARAASDVRHKAALLHEALALWRDEPLTEFDGEPFAAVAAPQLEDARLGAVEERIEADLALGRHADVVSELDALVAEHPYRERLRAQQMLALYRSGRQADALAAYRDAREAFATGLGLEPGPELKALEREILEQDPALDAPPAAEPVTAGTGVARRTPRRGWISAVGLLVSLAMIAVVVVILTTGGDSHGIVPPPDSVAVIDAATNEIVAAIPVGIRPGPITAGDGSVWVGNLSDRSITRIDTRLQRSAGTVPLAARTPTGLAFDRGIVWVAHGRRGSVSLVDAQFGNVTNVREVTEKGIYSSAGSIAAGSREMWAVFGDGTLARLDRVTGTVTGRTSTDTAPVGVAPGYGSVWVASASKSTVQRFSPLTLTEVASSTVGSRPVAIAVGFGDVWVTGTGADVVYRIDIGGGSIKAPISVGDGPTAITLGSDAVWIANTGSGTVSRIDPVTNTVVETIEIGEAPVGLIQAGGRLWVTVQER